MKKKKILIFSGAGISAESGIKTFRDSKDGLWENYKIEDVASIQGWNKNPQMVLDFYNQRRRECLLAQPNMAHIICAELQKDFDVCIATQNVDDLHERAGSTNVIHLHGELLKSRSSADKKLVYDCKGDMKIGDVCEKGSQLRPNIVFFQEQLNNEFLENATDFAFEAQICIIIGTTMKVYPAASIPWSTKPGCIIYYIDPNDVDFPIPGHKKGFFYHIKDKATAGMQIVREDIYNILNMNS